jgi:glycosyltransferase involved in cell wall biosynthesis
MNYFPNDLILIMMRKNILIFGHGYATGFIEATNQYTQLFDKNQYEVTIAYLDGEPNDAIIKKHLTDNIIFLNTPRNEKRGLKTQTIKTMLKLHQEKKFQIVICHRYKPTYVMLWVSRFMPIPRLFSVMHEMNTTRSIPRKLLIGLLASKNVIFAGVSNAVRDDIRSSIWRVKKDQVITLYNVIDTEKAEQELLSQRDARQQLGLADHTFIFGILGRLAKAKDHCTLINAFALAKPRCPNAKLLIMGDGELKDTLKTQIEQLGLTNDIIMTGFLPNAFGLLTALDVFILSSIKEAFGRVLIEAMIAKLPIIATHTNGIPEVVGDSGILIEKQSPSLLAEKMCEFYNMPKSELATWKEKSYQRAIKNFSMQCFNTLFWQLPLLKNS